MLKFLYLFLFALGHVQTISCRKILFIVSKMKMDFVVYCMFSLALAYIFIYNVGTYALSRMGKTFPNTYDIISIVNVIL